MKPGRPFTDDSSMLASVAQANGGLTFLACTIPGSLTSTAHVRVPSTFAGMSSRWSGWPVYFSSGTVLVFGGAGTEETLAPVRLTLNFLPPISSPYVTRLDGSAATEITASWTGH